MKPFVVLFFSLTAEEQLTTCCPCGNCSAFDRDRPRETSTVREEHNKGCALLSRWLPEEIDDQSRGELYEGINEQCGSVDFTYSSDKVRLKESEYLVLFWEIIFNDV